MAEHEVYWHQEDLPPVASWEFRINGKGNWEEPFVGTFADPCTTCYTTTIDAPYDSYWVQSRAIGVDGSVSPWGNTTDAPEPGFVLMLVMGFLVLWCLGARKRPNQHEDKHQDERS